MRNDDRDVLACRKLLIETPRLCRKLPHNAMWRVAFLLVFLSGQVSSYTTAASQARSQSCPQAKCYIDLINRQGRQEADVFRLKCGGCSRVLTWQVTGWLAAKLQSGVLEGVQVVKPKSEAPLMAFDGALNNVQHLVLTANVRGLEPLLPPLTGAWNYKVQKRLFQIQGLVNLTLADSVIQGLAPLVAESPPGDEDDTTLNPAVPRPKGETRAEEEAREVKWASYVHVKNCTFANTDLTLFGSSPGFSGFLRPVVETTGRACLLRLGTMYADFWPGHVLISNTTFDNITTSAPPGSGLRLHMLCLDTSSHNDTVTVRDSTFSNIQDVLGHSLDLIHTSMVYTGRLATKNLTMQRCRFTNIKAGLLAALEVAAVTVNNCSVNGARLAYGGFAVMSQYIQKSEFVNSSFSHIQLGAANDATPLNQDYYNPGVGLVKTSTMASAHVQGCMFKNLSLLPSASPLAHKPRQVADSAAFIRTAVIAAGANARVVQCTFVDCFTPAVVYAYSGEMETIGRVYSVGTANRGTRDSVVSLVVHESAFVRNMYGVYADGFQVIVSNCSFVASSVSGVRVSGVPCLVMNGTKLHGAAVSVQRASNPGGTAFSFCRMGWFPLWLNDRVQGASDVPGIARAAAALHNISGRLTDSFDSAVSVYMENVSISGVQGQPALLLRDVHKASLQRVSIFGNVGRGALQASSVTGLLLLQCRVVNNSAGLAADTLNVAGGGTFTAVNSLYLLETVFAGNVGPEAGAMLLQSCGLVVINSCTYHDNTARQSGGAVRAIASESIVVDTSTLQQPDNIRCMQTNVLGVMYDHEFRLGLSGSSQDQAACPKARLGGRATTFSGNSAGASGGAIAIEGLTLAAFSATRVDFLGNRAKANGGAVAVLGAGRHIVWSLRNAALLRNSAAGSGGALAFTVPVQGILCQHCHLQGNTAGLLGGALFSTSKGLCAASRNQQGCMGDNVTFTDNMAASGGANAYLADAAAADSIANDSPARAGQTRSSSKTVQNGRLQCSRQNLNKTGSTLRVSGPPCALVLWSPAAGTLLPYVNNGSGLPTINATVVDCWCSTVQLLPGAASSASLVPLTARLVFNNTVLLEKAVGPDGHVVFDKVDFNQPPQQYNLTLQLSPATESALAADVPKPLPINLTVQARPCTTGEELGIDGRCRACSANTYGRNGQCLKCKEGARCPGGALLLPEEGWWHSAPTSDVFIPCLQPEACRGSRGQLQDYQQQHYDELERAMVHRALLAIVEPDYQSAVCSDGYGGHLCASCGLNRSRTRTYRCETCTSPAAIIGVAVLGALVGVFYVWFISASTIKDTKQQWGTLKVSDATYCLTWFLQLLFVLATIPVTWPPAIAWLPKAAETTLSSFSSSTSSLACLLKPSQSMPSVAGQMIIIQMCLMLLLPGVVVLLELFAAACKPVMSDLKACFGARRGRQAAMAQHRRGVTGKTLNAKQRVIITVLSSLLLFFPTILQTTMSLFVCKTLDPGDGSGLVYRAQSKHGWWMPDLDNTCYSGWHAKFALAFGLPCLLFWCLGIPLVAAAVPIWAWKRNKLQEDHYRETYGFLHWRYRDDRWYYSIVQRSWLLVLVVGVVFTSGDTMLQLFVYEAVLMVSLICLIVFNPAGALIAGQLDICVNLAALLNGFAAVFCVASTMDSGVITGSSFGMGSSGRVGLGVVVVFTNGVLLLSIIAFIIKVQVATWPQLGQAVQKMRTWGAGIVHLFRLA